jgi:hypothetical protein
MHKQRLYNKSFGRKEGPARRAWTCGIDSRRRRHASFALLGTGQLRKAVDDEEEQAFAFARSRIAREHCVKGRIGGLPTTRATTIVPPLARPTGSAQHPVSHAMVPSLSNASALHLLRRRRGSDKQNGVLLWAETV